MLGVTLTGVGPVAEKLDALAEGVAAAIAAGSTSAAGALELARRKALAATVGGAAKHAAVRDAVTAPRDVPARWAAGPRRMGV